jgi:Mlc titration factor MtfA (ptsG expression regulator)
LDDLKTEKEIRIKSVNRFDTLSQEIPLLTKLVQQKEEQLTAEQTAYHLQKEQLITAEDTVKTQSARL